MNEIAPTEGQPPDSLGHQQADDTSPVKSAAVQAHLQPLGSKAAMPTFKSAVHRTLWQRFPYGLRRRVLFSATSMLAPRPTRGALAAGPIVVAGALSTASGLGQSARLCHDALKLAGADVMAIDLTSALMQPSDFSGFSFIDGRAVMGPATLLLHVNSPLVPMALMHLGRQFVKDKHIVGSWAWELPRLPVEWQIGVPFVHQIMVHSKFVSVAIQPIAGARPVHVLPPPIIPLRSRTAPRRCASGKFTVLTIFNAASSIARKNPIAAVTAFREAFGNDSGARLVIKASNLATVSDGMAQLEAAIGGVGNISIIDSVIDEDDIDALYAEADVVLSLHRSEGFGLIMAEAMARGLPVVGTNWSGNVDFLTEDTGIPVPFRLVAAEDRQDTYNYPEMMWAEADAGYAAMALRRLRTDSALADKLGTQAARFAATAWAPKHYAETLAARLGTSSTKHVSAA